MMFLYEGSITALLPIEDGVEALHIAYEQPGECYSVHDALESPIQV